MPLSWACNAGDKGAKATTAAKMLARNFNIESVLMAVLLLEGVSLTAFTY
jgi:hypothetical protein